MASNRDRIKVVCRIRPENAIEKSGNYKRCVEYDQKNISVECITESKVSDMSGKHDFAFDAIFGPDSRQIDVFQEVAAPVVNGVLDGYNGTIFAYGQTGSGKSFTMEGIRGNEELAGIIPRMFDYLFSCISKSDSDIEFTIKCSYLEIYMEKIMDLLDAKKTNLQVKEDKTRGLYVQDATEVYVSSTDEMMDVMNAGSQNRSVAATRMNATSSRSHSIFLVTVQQKNVKTDTSKQGKLYCCDLAGSEKVEKTEAKGTTLDEAKMINKSLSALGNVINALTESKSKGSFIPYRDSKLTRILQESLGGNSQTCLVITCSMSQYNDRETLSTLRFGNRAKSIKNAVKQNAQLSAKELLNLLNISEAKIKQFQNMISQIQFKIEEAFSKYQSNETEISHCDKNDISKELITNISWIYKTKDHEMLQRLLDASSELILKDNSQVKDAQDAFDKEKIEESQKTNKKDSTQIFIDDNTSHANILLINSLQKQIQELKNEKQIILWEKQQQDEEIKQLNNEIYLLNEKFLLMENSAENDQSQIYQRVYFQSKDKKKFLENVDQNDNSLQGENKVNKHKKKEFYKFKDIYFDKIQSIKQSKKIYKIKQQQKQLQKLQNKVYESKITNKLIQKYIQSLNLNKNNILKRHSQKKTDNAQKNFKYSLIQQEKVNGVLEDQTMITEKEYINFLTENKARGVNGEIDETFQDSFFRSIIPQVGSSSAAGGASDEKNKATEDENQVLKEINEQQIKKIQELQKLNSDLEDQIQALEKDQLVILKKQAQLVTSSSAKLFQNQSDDFYEKDTCSKTGGDTQYLIEEAIQIALVKDKQIDLLSNMLAQKEVQIKNNKLEYETTLNEQNQNIEKISQVYQLEIQNLNVKINQFQSLFQSCKVSAQESQNEQISEESKQLFLKNYEQMLDQNRQLKNQVTLLNRLKNQKERDLIQALQKLSEYEKRFVLLQKNAKDAMMIQKMNQEAGISNVQIKNLIMPFSSSGINNSSFSMNQYGSNKFNPPSFLGQNIFNSKVFKPIRGGGQTDQQANSDPFKGKLSIFGIGNLNFNQDSRFSTAQDFNSFQNIGNRNRSTSKTAYGQISKKDFNRQSMFNQMGSQKQSQQLQNNQDGLQLRSPRINFNEQVNNQLGKAQSGNTSSQNFQTQEQMLKHAQKQQIIMQKAKKIVAQQKISDARKLTAQQMMQDESAIEGVNEDLYNQEEDYEKEDDTYINKAKQNDRRNQRDELLNDTYADFDRADLDGEDPSETKDDYDSECEDHVKRNVFIPEKMGNNQAFRSRQSIILQNEPLELKIKPKIFEQVKEGTQIQERQNNQQIIKQSNYYESNNMQGAGSVNNNFNQNDIKSQSKKKQTFTAKIFEGMSKGFNKLL